MREKNCYSEKSDVYSLGIILWELMSRQTPFSEFTAAAIPPVIVLGKRPLVQPDWNATFKVLMAQCWGPLPSHRPLVREVRNTLDSISLERYFYPSHFPLSFATVPFREKMVLTFFFFFFLCVCSGDGLKTPTASINSSLTSTPNDIVDIAERANAPRGHVTLVFTDVENSATVCSLIHL
jgi:hypothetical protein